MEATYFRNRARIAREMAHEGEDARLAQMLLELADEMEAEADSIEAARSAAQTQAAAAGLGA